MSKTLIAVAGLTALFSQQLIAQMKPMTLPVKPVPRRLDAAAPVACSVNANGKAISISPPALEAPTRGVAGRAPNNAARERTGARPHNTSVSLVAAVISATAPGNDCTAPPSKTQFASTDSGGIYAFTSVNGAANGDTVHWDWVGPDGTIYFAADYSNPYNGVSCFWSFVNVSDVAPHPGSWTVNISYNGMLLTTLSFSVSGSGQTASPSPTSGCSSQPGKICRDEISTFYQGAHSLGTAWVRMVFEPPTPSAMAISQVQNSLGNLITGLSGVPCVHYDTSKIQSLINAIPSMASQDVVTAVGALIPDVQSAVHNASLSCDSSANFESLYVVGVDLGAAIAEAIGFMYSDPLSGDAITFITSLLTDASAAMANYVPCGGAFTPGLLLPSNFDLTNQFVLVPLTQLIGTYNLLVWNVSLSCCCCTCSA